RGLARTPAFSLSVILLLGAGVGSASAIFAVVDHVLLRPLPYPEADRLIRVENGSHSVPAIRDLQAMRSIGLWGAGASENAHLTATGDPLRVRQAIVTDGFFPLFGAQAEVGRLLQSADSQVPNTAVLSYGTWMRVFGGDRKIVGRTIHINDLPVLVVGVLSKTFEAPAAIVGENVDLWRPLDPAADYMNNRSYWKFELAGRLRPGATLTQARLEASSVAKARAELDPKRYIDNGKVMDLPLKTMREATTGSVERPLQLLLGAVGLLLLVACVNVTHLFLAWGVGRNREMALRRALGARTRSLVAQLLIESSMLGVAGAALGALIAYAGVHAFLTLMPAGIPRAATIAVDAPVLFFAAGIGMFTVLLFGLLPALRLAGRGSGNSLRGSGRTHSEGRGAHRFRNALVVGEVALSLVLVAQAGWLLRSFIRMSQVDLGFRTTGVVEIPMDIPARQVTGASPQGTAVAEWTRRMEAIRESVGQIRGVDGVAFGLSMPLEWVGGGKCCWSSLPQFAGKQSPERPMAVHPVSDEFFTLFDIRFAAGESWPRGTLASNSNPAVISEQLATQVFGSATAAMGGLFVLGKTNFRIVGVARETKYYGADQASGTPVYIPTSALPFAPDNVTLAVRTERSDNAIGSDIRTAIWRTEPSLPIPQINPVVELSRRDSANRRFDAVLFGTFSVVALLLVAGGVAGTLLYMVRLQKRSLGIRLALGATPQGIARGVLSNGLGLAGLGVLLGTVGAWFAGRLIESRLYGVEARDPRTLALAVAVLLLVAFVASWIPARRAAITNPIESLRAE
ncbi:MAG: ADOP family duplicated permease, partial [Gemmatimonadales bacterium]